MSYTVTNPYNGEVVKQYPDAKKEEISQALDAAEEFYQLNKKIKPEVRAIQLKAFADVMEQNKEELARKAAINMGKLLREGRGEVDLCVKILRYYAQQGPNLLKPKPYIYEMHKEAFLHYDAIGTVLSVEPWNFPYSQVIRVLAPNYLIGNPVILKHAGIVAGCAELLEQLGDKAKLGTGAFKNLFITHKQVEEILADKRVQGVALTGSEKAGSIIAQQAGANLIKSTMELGGSDAFIVLDDADLDKTVNDAVAARLRNCGQVCTSAKRYIVEEKVAEKFTKKISKIFEELTIGNPLDENTQLAPLSSASATTDLDNQVKRAIENGAKVVVAGGKVENKAGNFFKPVILTDIVPENPAYYEEFFGPVAQIHVVKDDEAAIKLANDSNFGLAGAVYSSDPKHALEVARQVETGQIFINQPSSAHPELPFGGIKNSGYGREMSDIGLYEFTNQKIIVL